MYMAGMLALVLTFGLILAGCDLGGGGGGGINDPNDPFAGTWEGSSFRIVATSGTPGTFTNYRLPGNIEAIHGTYTYTGNTVVGIITEVNTVIFGGNDEWVAWDDLDDYYKQQYISSQIQTLTISGNSFTSNGETFTKQGGSNNNGSNNNGNPFEGTWLWTGTKTVNDDSGTYTFVVTSVEYTFYNDNTYQGDVEMTMAMVMGGYPTPMPYLVRGTYTYSGNTATYTQQEQSFDGGNNWTASPEPPRTASVNGNKLSISGEQEIWIKQSGSNNNGNDNGGSGNPDSALVAKWYIYQSAADQGGDDYAFEITSNGKMTGRAVTGDITVTTSNGRISATATVNGQTADAGSAGYVVNGTALTFSNLTMPGLFYNLNLAVQPISGLPISPDGSYHKKAGGSSGDYPAYPGDGSGWEEPEQPGQSY
jgi:hypothetical protein